MKKITTILLSLLMLLCFAACGGQDTPAEPTPSPSPTPMPEWAELTQAYEVWVEEFLALSDYVIANPSDTTAYEQFTSALNEAGDWGTQIEDMSASLADQPAQLEEFVNEVNRITQRMHDYLTDLNDYLTGMDSK